MATSTRPLAQAVQVAPRYRRSVNVGADIQGAEFMRGYVVSPLVAQTVERITSGAAREGGGRAWTIIGPYGTGKSALAAFVSRLVGCDTARTSGVGLLASKSKAASRSVRQLRRETGGLLVVPIEGRRVSFSQALLEGLVAACASHWSGPGKKPAVLARARKALRSAERGVALDDADVVDIYVEAAEAVSRSRVNGGGLLLVVDEMGKLLEWAVHHPQESDVYILQLLAERAARLEAARLVVVGILHQAFESYAKSLPESVRNEWSKIQGRFESIPFLEPSSHQVHLLGEAIGWRDKTAEREALKGSRAAAALLGESSEVSKSLADALVRTAPLNPVASLLLGPLFRERLGQNERSVFSFLASNEPGGLREWTESATPGELFPLDALYDYVRSNSALFSTNGTSARVWAICEDALARMPDGAAGVDERILKAVAVLSAVGAAVGVAASPTVLRAALWPLSKTALTRSARRLAGASLVVFRQFRGAWQLWDGSDIDVDAAVREQLERLRTQGGLASTLQRVVPPAPLTAPRHYYRTGTFRYFLTRYIDIDAVSLPGGTGEADGILYLAVPGVSGRIGTDQAARLQELVDRADIPSALALPGTPAAFRQAGLELLAAHEAQRRTVGLENDRVARRELAGRLAAASDRFHVSHDRSFGLRKHASGEWWSLGRSWTIDGQASKIASSIFDAIYPSAPVLKNELLNRRDLSTAAASARRALMERMITHATEPRLGIDGHPAELSMYLSVLQTPNIHAQTGASMSFKRPPSGQAIRSTWDELGKYIASDDAQRVSLASLYASLARPPFGVRAGVAPVLFLAYFLAHEDAICIYEEGTFVPAVGPDLVHRLLRRPETFEVQHAHASGLTRYICRRLAEGWGSRREMDTGLLSVVRATMRLVAGLSPFASQTRRVSPRAQRLRSAIKGARDPVQLLLKDIHEALDLQPVNGTPRSAKVQKNVDKLVLRFHAARQELEAAEADLMAEAGETLARLMGANGVTPRFVSEIKGRAERLVDVLDLPPLLRRFAQVTSTASTTDRQSVSEWLYDVGTLTVGKPPSHWRDEDLQTFAQGAMRICRGFLSGEQLTLELKSMKASPTRVVRVSVLDAEGSEESGIAVLRSEDEGRVENFIRGVRQLACEHGVADSDLRYAVITALLPAEKHARQSVGAS